MFNYQNWCLLCASFEKVDVGICSLEDNLKETIGQFSIINFTLTGIPSNICQPCHEFLKDFEERKARYAKAEQMFMELLKMRNKPVDVSIIRQKYGLDKTASNREICVPVDKEQSFQLTEQVIDEMELCDNADISPPEEPSVIAPLKIQTERVPLVAPIATITKPPAAKLLNPTIRPKISNIVRLDLFNCDLCLHSCSTKTAMERHMLQIHLIATSVSFNCKVCSKSFAKKIILQNHEKIHLTHRPTFDCKVCGKVLSSRTAVSNHMQWLHNEKRKYSCAVCSKLFATKGSLKEHEKIHSCVKAHICPICKKSYKTASTLSQHIDTHGKTYNCSECSAQLNSKRTLRQHMLKHSDIVRHTCDFCNAQFKRTKAYKEHLISLHTNIRAYSCDWCQKKFSNGANCRKHKKEAHPAELALADQTSLKTVVKLPRIEEILTIGQEKLAAAM